MSPDVEDGARTVHHRPARPTERREAIRESAGERRRRTRNRGQ